ncbi:hypothetical protein Tco_1134106 [Tanacetum coccineum]
MERNVIPNPRLLVPYQHRYHHYSSTSSANCFRVSGVKLRIPSLLIRNSILSRPRALVKIYYMFMCSMSYDVVLVSPTLWIRYQESGDNIPLHDCERYEGVEVCKTFYACSDSLLLTPLCCDDIHEVTPRVSALAGCDRLVSEPLVIENYVSLTRKKFCWETIFPIGLKRYRDPKEEPIENEPLMELKEIG